jgi:hypothetical protein
MRRAPHPLEEALQSRVRLLATTLRPATAAHYYQTVRVFLAFLREAFPQVRRASDLRRDPHLLGWLEHLWMRRHRCSGKPLSNPSRAAYLIRLRRLLELLADHASPPRSGLLVARTFRVPIRRCRARSRPQTMPGCKPSCAAATICRPMPCC